MIQKISDPVTVTFTYNSINRSCMPSSLVWQGRLYAVRKIGFHHKYRRGNTLFHVFSVVAATLFFRLVFNTDTLSWSVEEIADGLPN